ncbi:MAG: hypothetical protein KDK97_24580, partial [Verrucomicrobiales bacterium]|nr:hypothetical protein [Verrucomicrobiales bacterium]
GKPANQTGIWGLNELNAADITAPTSPTFAQYRKLNPAVLASTNVLAYTGVRTGPGISAANDEALSVVRTTGSGIPSIRLQEGTALNLPASLTGRVISHFGPIAVGATSNNIAVTANIRAVGGAGSIVVTRANDSAAFMIDAFGTQVGGGIFEGENSPLIGIQYGQVTPRIAMGDSNPVVSVGLTGETTGNAAVVRLGGAILARKGEPTTVLDPPATTTPAFATFLGESSPSPNASILRATVSGVPASQREGLWHQTLSDTFVLGGVFPFAQKGVQVPGMAAGIKFSRFLRYGVTPSGSILVHAVVSGPGVNSTNDGIVIAFFRFTLSSSFLPQILVREGDEAPDTQGLRIASILQVDTSDSV